jgi:hypothetical protein
VTALSGAGLWVDDSGSYTWTGSGVTLTESSVITLWDVIYKVNSECGISTTAPLTSYDYTYTAEETTVTEAILGSMSNLVTIENPDINYQGT